MRQRMSLFFVFFLFFFVKVSAQTNNTFSISARVSTNKVALNQNFKVTVEIKAEGNINDYIFSTPFIDKLHNMEIIGTASENTTSPSSVSNRIISVKKYIYTLKPTSIGMAYFPKILVSITDKKGNIVAQIDTQAIPIEILEPVVQKDYKIIYIVIALFLIIGLGVLIFIKFKLMLKEKKENISESNTEEINTEEQYLNEINEELNKDRLNKEKIELSIKILKKYLEEKYGLRIRNKSSKEIEKILNEINVNNKERIIDLIKKTDLIKYAQEEPDNKAVEEIISSIIEIIKAGGENNE